MGWAFWKSKSPEEIAAALAEVRPLFERMRTHTTTPEDEALLEASFRAAVARRAEAPKSEPDVPDDEAERRVHEAAGLLGRKEYAAAVARALALIDELPLGWRGACEAIAGAGCFYLGEWWRAAGHYARCIMFGRQPSELAAKFKELREAARLPVTVGVRELVEASVTAEFYEEATKGLGEADRLGMCVARAEYFRIVGAPQLGLPDLRQALAIAPDSADVLTRILAAAAALGDPRAKKLLDEAGGVTKLAVPVTSVFLKLQRAATEAYAGVLEKL